MFKTLLGLLVGRATLEGAIDSLCGRTKLALLDAGLVVHISVPEPKGHGPSDGIVLGHGLRLLHQTVVAEQRLGGSLVIGLPRQLDVTTAIVLATRARVILTGTRAALAGHLFLELQALGLVKDLGQKGGQLALRVDPALRNASHKVRVLLGGRSREAAAGHGLVELFSRHVDATSRSRRAVR